MARNVTRTTKKNFVAATLKFNGRTNQFISMVLFKTERRGNLYEIGV